MMFSRRTVLRWSVGVAAVLVADLESMTRGGLSRTSAAQEPTQPVQNMSIETWMNGWLSVSKAPGGMLRISRFREPIYFLTARWFQVPSATGE